MRRVLLLSLLVHCLTPSLHAQATIEGRVQLPAPSARFGFNQRYAATSDVAAPAVNPPAAIVYLEGDFGRLPEPGAPAVMAQKNQTFTPDLLAIPVGGSVIFPNYDDIYHNVFSYSKPKRFDLGRYRKEEKPVPVHFGKPGAVTIHCEIHETMRGTVLVLATPHFVKTDIEGNYRLEHLPAGRYLLKAWVDGNDIREHWVDLKANQTLHVDFRGAR